MAPAFFVLGIVFFDQLAFFLGEGARFLNQACQGVLV